jgi:LysR family transcriptional activator of nhaA
LLAFRLLEPLMHLPQAIRLRCDEGKYENLLADLALHKLDVVLTDRPPPSSGNLRLFSHSLGNYEITLFGSASLTAQYRPNFPASLNNAPLLLPTRNNELRSRIDQWLEQYQIRPDIVGEFQDTALLKTFGRSGLGLFPAPTILTVDLERQFSSYPVGKMEQVQEQFFAISNERKIQHPALEAMLAAAGSVNSSTEN